LHKKPALLQSKIIHIEELSSLHTYFKKYNASFEDHFFVSQSLTNAVSLLKFIPNTCLQLLATSGPEQKNKKKNLKPDTSGLNFPHHTH